MFMHREFGKYIQPFFPLAEWGPQVFSSISCHVSASLLGAKDIGIVKSQTGHQLFKVTQAPGWK